MTAFVSIDAWAELRVLGLLCLVWLGLYLTIRHVLFPQFSADSANRMVSVVHASISLLAIPWVLNLGALRADVGTPTSSGQLQVLRISLSYFVYDMLCCLAIELYDGRLDVATALHHVASIMGLQVGVFQRTSGHELLMCLVLMEVSSPFMHWRYILREFGWAGTKMADINDICFAVSFLVCRNVLGLFVVYWTVMSAPTPLLVKLGGLGILLVSWFWTHKLLTMVQRKLSKTAKRA